MKKYLVHVSQYPALTRVCTLSDSDSSSGPDMGSIGMYSNVIGIGQGECT